MLKQVLILAGAVCAIAVVATASQDDPVAVPVAETPAEPVKKVAPKAPDPWAADDDFYAESETGDFKFGEPLVYSEDGDTVSSGDDGDIQKAPSVEANVEGKAVTAPAGIAGQPASRNNASQPSKSSGPVRLGRPVQPVGSAPPADAGPPVKID